MRAGARPRLMFFTAALVTVLSGCTSTPPTVSRPSASPSAATTTRTIVPVPSSVQEIPGQPPFVHYGTVDDPEAGVAYEYHLFVHCGIRTAKFGGRWWSAVAPTDNPFPDNRMAGSSDPNYVKGSMTLIAPDLARFEWEGGSADFTPSRTEPPPCA